MKKRSKNWCSKHQRNHQERKHKSCVYPGDALIKRMPTGCWFCGVEMIWGGDFSFEDYGKEGEGIVANLSCPNCKAYAEFWTGEEDD